MLNLKIEIPFCKNNSPKSLYLVIMSNLTHLQGRNTKGEIYVKNFWQKLCRILIRIRNPLKSRIRNRKKIIPDAQSYSQLPLRRYASVFRAQAKGTGVSPESFHCQRSWGRACPAPSPHSCPPSCRRACTSLRRGRRPPSPAWSPLWAACPRPPLPLHSPR